MLLDKRRCMIVLLCILILLMSIGFGYGYMTRHAEDPQKKGIELGDSGQVPISQVNPVPVNRTEADGILILERRYLGCGTVLQEEMALKTQFVGLAREELLFSFPGWEIIGFTPERVHLAVEMEGYCPQHYMVMEQDGYVAIFQGEKETGSLVLLQVTRIPMTRLDSALRAQIEEGLQVDSLLEVEQILENLDS